MEANELRIGNLVCLHFTNQNLEIKSIEYWKDSDYIIIFDGNIIENLKKLKPITLTEDWLIKFGFEDRNDYWKKKKVKMVWSSRIIKTGERLGIRHEKYDHIQYVHQLQNLYFALTGNELTVRE
jgi:hypothetical protein